MTTKLDKLLVDLLFKGKLTQWQMVAIGQAVEEYKGTNGVVPPVDKALAQLKEEHTS